MEKEVAGRDVGAVDEKEASPGRGQRGCWEEMELLGALPLFFGPTHLSLGGRRDMPANWQLQKYVSHVCVGLQILRIQI